MWQNSREKGGISIKKKEIDRHMWDGRWETVKKKKYIL